MTVTYTQTATERKAVSGVALGKGMAGELKILLESTVELATATAASQLVKFGVIPSNARISGASRIYWDDLATTGSPTLDLGLAAVNGNITDDDDALNDGLAISAVSTANVGAQVIKDIANFGKQAWQFVNGQSTDPGGQLAVYGSVKDAATTQAGSVSLTLYGYLD